MSRRAVHQPVKVVGGSHGQCSFDRGFFSRPVSTPLLAAVAKTIQRSFGIEGRTHGHKSGDRGYPLATCNMYDLPRFIGVLPMCDHGREKL